MNIFLKSPYPCLIKTNNEYVELDENDTLQLQDEDIIFIYPQNNEVIPFYINLKTLIENQNYSVSSKDDKKIIFLEKLPNLEVAQKEILEFSGKTCQISIQNNNSLEFETETKKLRYKCQHSCKNYKVFKIKNFACIQFKDDLYVYSTTKNKLLHFSGDEINIKDDEMELTKKFHDSINREKKARYKFEEDIKIDKEEFMYQSADSTDPQLLPYKLLEGIKAKDYSYVMNCLSSKLKDQLNDDQLNEFFGNVSAFLPLSTTEFITISNHQKNFVTFNIIGNKIDDILIDGL